MDWNKTERDWVHWATSRSGNPQCTAVAVPQRDNSWVVHRHDGTTKGFRGRNAERQMKAWVETLAKLDGLT